MGLFSRRKRSENDALRTQAEKLVMSAQILATSAYTSVGERFDLVYSIPTERWDSVLTVAGVFIAATRLNHVGLPEARVDSLMEIVARNLHAWRPEGLAAFEDCKAFFDRTYDALGACRGNGFGDDATENAITHLPQDRSSRSSQYVSNPPKSGSGHFSDRLLEKDTAYQHQPELLGSDAIGGWMVWNLVEHAPDSEQERGLVRALGILVTHTFFSWWSGEPAAYIC